MGKEPKTAILTSNHQETCLTQRRTKTEMVGAHQLKDMI